MLKAILPAAIASLLERRRPVVSPDSILRFNIKRLGKELARVPGRKVAIFGQPGAGKSSLLKNMTDAQVRPLPCIGSQTDATDWSTDPACELLSFHEREVYVDAPGHDTLNHPVNAFAPNFPFAAFDAFVFVISGKLHDADCLMFQRAMESRKSMCIARSFAESLTVEEAVAVERDLRRKLAAPAKLKFVFFSNRTREGVKHVQRFAKGE
ncbi:hypothetical protein C2L64_46350 [Paraburkholderia hospita]|uniref:G domain-containing protein n=1 Tax=Paraburkholderia hospita TaxID=169430 RepID=A0AAN1JMR1_9BURK|nr:hypothetical protein C2L64_46350 [Paraburkholderia hospita]